MGNVEAVVFKNKDGHSLFGIFHNPDVEERRDTVIFLLSPGVKMRVAPHRLYNKMAEKFVSMGFPVFRFDFYGLGDAEGSIDEPILADVYNSIQDGRFVDDTISAMDWVEQTVGYKKFILSGLCGGAITGLLAAENDPRVVGLLNLNIPVAFEASPSDKHRFMTEKTITKLRGGYFKRLLEPKSWLRLLTFQSDYNVIFRVIGQLFNRKDTTKKSNKDGSKNSDLEIGVKGNVNPKFEPAFFNLLESSRKILLVFCGADRWISEYEEKFEASYANRLEKYGSKLNKHVIESANHVLTDSNWQNEMITVSEKWLKAF